MINKFYIFKGFYSISNNVLSTYIAVRLYIQWSFWSESISFSYHIPFRFVWKGPHTSRQKIFRENVSENPPIEFEYKDITFFSKSYECYRPIGPSFWPFSLNQVKWKPEIQALQKPDLFLNSELPPWLNLLHTTDWFTFNK